MSRAPMTAASIAAISAIAAAGLATTGCMNHHILYVNGDVLLPKLVDIDRRGRATVPATDQRTEDPTSPEGRAVKISLTGADTLPLPEGPVRLDVLARRCLDPSPALAGPDPCALRRRRDETFLIRRTSEVAVGKTLGATALALTFGGLAFGATCAAGACDGAPDVKHAGEVVGVVALSVTLGAITWGLFHCLTSRSCRD
jgi:hypothetical protein